jgi:hypothetical protein
MQHRCHTDTCIEKTSVSLDPDLSVDIDKLQFQENLKAISTYQLKVLEPKRVRKSKQAKPSPEVTPLTALFTIPDRYLWLFWSSI